MTRELRVGLVGANASYGWGKTAHVPAIAAAPGVTLHAVASRSRDDAEAAARAFGADLAFTSPEDLAASPDVDVVAVAVRAPVHREVVSAALRHGKPVYCEWPLGVDLAEAEEMAAAAAEAGVPTAVGLQGRHSPWLLHLRRAIAGGAIGRVLAANLVGHDGMPYEAWSRANAYMLRRESGANSLSIHTGHSLDNLAFVLGEFASVSGIAAATRPSVTIRGTGEVLPLSAPDQIAVALRTREGAVVGAQIFGGTVPGPAIALLVQGTGGLLRATSRGYMSWRAVEVAVAPDGSGGFAPVPIPDGLFALPRVDDPGPEYTLAHAYSAFASAVREGTRFRPDFADAVERHRTVEAIAVLG